ncbi:type III pantothenate kinase [Methylococcus sp. EFPC2]|uniref:type III pantothenate kinase n=1 Tax=Methylococcus sp. EFPC2 TaxID=2812648 RepID=UPI0019685DE6|nr:type III pantothenate kinase [Methylococcus sp. EFPC2]QSA97676.1 type III pantothenate kinase [Methylococcus sp. EFPC2]
MSDAALLLIDIGNSRIKWGWADAGGIAPGEPFVGSDFSAAWSGLPRPSAVWISNVAGPEYAERLRDWVSGRWGLDAHFARSEARACGVINGYDEPARLGVDRWLALIGARGRYAGPLCVADCGTAITVDVLSASGEHLGGVIAPGLALMNEALGKRTHALSPAGRALVFDLARETESAIAAGVYGAAAGLIEWTRDAAAKRLGSLPRLILTGGDGERLAPAWDEAKLVPELILDGLRIMALETR